MGYWLTFIGFFLTLLGVIFQFAGFLNSPNDNFFRGQRSIIQRFIKNSSVNIKNSPGAVVNVNQTQINYVASNLLQEGATKAVTDKLLEISKIIKDDRLQEAESLLRNFEKQTLTKTDLTNIQSVRASLYLIRGKLPEAKAIYEAILDTQVKSNAVYTGLATISAFEAFGKRNSNPKEAARLLYQSNDWYFKAADIDKRPQVLVTIYHGIYDNFRILVNFFNVESEKENLTKYKKLFEEYNQQADYPFKAVRNADSIEKKSGLTKIELVDVLRSKGLNFDISALPNDVIIDSYSIDTSNPLNPILVVEHSELK